MSGNVWEWTLSKYADLPYRADDGRDAIDASDDSRVLRGGASVNYQGVVRCAYRLGNYPSDLFGSYGFRVALSPSF